MYMKQIKIPVAVNRRLIPYCIIDIKIYAIYQRYDFIVYFYDDYLYELLLIMIFFKELL